MDKLVYGLLILLIIFTVYSLLKRYARKCGCRRCRNERFFSSIINEELDYPKLEDNLLKESLFDVEQTPLSRGDMLPNPEPNHVINRWKSNYSHAKQKDGTGFLDTVFASDYPTPIRGALVSQDVGDVSCSHLITRFGNTRS